MAFQKYSAELKYSAVRYAINGKTLEQINQALGSKISPDSMRQWKSLYERTRAVVCDPETYAPRGRPLELTTKDHQFIKELVTDKPTMYLDEIQRSLSDQHGILVCKQTISNTLHKHLYMSRKTLRTVHPSQDADERAVFLAWIACIPTSCLVFTDESGVSLEVARRTRGWAPVGQRTPRVPCKRSKHQYNIIPAISMTGLVAHMVQEDAVDRFSFEFFLENILIPLMNPFPFPQSVLVLDNAQIHHNGRIAEIVEGKGCLIQYLPAYSPDLNPIEKDFAVYKANLRRCEDLLTGGEEDYTVIDEFVRLVFTSDLTRSLFFGSGYGL